MPNVHRWCVKGGCDRGDSDFGASELHRRRVRRSRGRSDGADAESRDGRGDRGGAAVEPVDVDRAVKAAGAACDEWSASTPGERAAALLKLADAIEEHADELAELESDNAGKPINAFRDDEIPFMADNLRFFAGAARCLEGRAAGEYISGYTSIIRREPVGVIGQIAPWNYPLMMAVWKIGPALAAGNTVVLKPAETTPLTVLKLAEYVAEIFPKGVLNVITGHGDPTGQALVTHDDVNMISLTGSVDTGKWIARAASDTLKRVHLELGGKAPVVVFDDVDMSTALETIAGTGYYNAGQDCTAATRVLASSKVLDDVVGGLAEQAKGLVLGDTRSADTTLGRPTRPASASGWRASSSASRTTWRSSRAAASPIGPGSSSSRPSSPGCARTTR